MTVSASIAFTQGAQVGAPGVAIIGTTGTNVVASNGNDSNVVTWTWTMVDVAQGSALPTGVIATGAVPNVTFNPDVPGGYLLSLTTTDNSGNTAVDYRAFQVPETTGRIIPPFKGTDQSLNFIISSVMNLRGWAPFQWAYDHEVDILSAGMVFEQSGTPIAGAPHFTLNVTGAGGTIADAGGGVALLNLSGGGGSGGPGNIMWVALNGNDSTGTGAFTNPFLTPAAAVAAINASSSPATSSNPWLIQMGPGAFGALSIVPWIRVAGWPSSKNKSAVTTFTSIGLGSGWTSGQASGVSDCRVVTTGNITLNFSSAGATLADVDFTRCDWSGTCTCTGTVSNSSEVTFTDCQMNMDAGFFNNLTVTNMSVRQQNSQLGVVSLTSNSTNIGAWTGLGGSAGAFGNGVDVITSGSASFNVQLLGVDVGVGPVSLIGTNISYSTTPEGIPTSGIGFGGGASITNVTLWGSANGVGYTPANTVNWSGTAPTSIANALDRIAAKITPIP